ncbi:SiaB family protein kinase [Candidatus Magnetobacterium casense]|uniref:Uncharacterized protein n=1 Tax=Candidatus Magnetobacterium casense TaxID=1455061 RepID=A0ABS6S1K5_9BACT|nr:SiaB family protein kinase [Candidatus Magnetobacterium casensis]MBV6342733.1 hypothetical protein [Candidatus Magnetobacterium casensis]
MLTDLYELYRQMLREQIVLCFSGPVSQHVVEGIGATLKLKMEIEEQDINTIQRVFSIFVEQMQNLMNYSAERISQERDGGDLGIGVFVVGFRDGHFYVRCGNKIRNDKLNMIREQVDELRGLNSEELKALYRRRRKEPSPEGSKGGGLGFIEMARKASQPIDIDYTTVDEAISFLSVTVYI